MKQVLFFLLLCFSNALCFSQEVTDISTDRPDQTETATTVPLKSLQIETGLTNEFSIFSRVYSNGTLLRYGLLNNFELRLEPELVCIPHDEYSNPKPKADIGIVPLGIGGKYHLSRESGIFPEFGIIASSAILPLCSPVFQIDFIPLKLNAAFSNTLSETFSLGYNLGIECDGENPRLLFFYTVSLGIALSSKLGSFVETFGLFSEDFVSESKIDAGFTYKIKPLVQLDLSGGLSTFEGIYINRYPRNPFVSIGFSFRTK